MHTRPLTALLVLCLASAAFASANISFYLPNSIPTGREKAESIRLSFGVRHGKGFGAVLWPRGSIVDTSLAAVVEGADLKVEKGALAGSVTMRIRLQGQATPVTYVVALTGQIADQKVTGEFQTKLDGKTVMSGQLVGGQHDTSAAPPAADGMYNLILHDNPDGTYSQIYFQARGGRITNAFACTPDWNNATHEVDASAVSIAGDRLTGPIKLTIFPDPWIPKDRKTVTGSLALDATIKDRQVVGSYTGTLRDASVQGGVSGELQDPVPNTPPKRITFKIENGLTGGTEWQNRAFITMDLDGERVVKGTVGNNHTKLHGTVTNGTIKWTPEGYEASVELNIEPGGNVKEGKYSVSAKGPIVGNISLGAFECKYQDGQAKTGRYWAIVKREIAAVSR